MRAARSYAAGDVRVVPTPEPSDDEILIQVEWCGICGSDINEYLFGPFAIPNPKTGPHPLTNNILPVTMGHEFKCRIIHVPEALAEKSTTSDALRPGQAVVIDPRFYCSSCTACSHAATNCCQSIGFLGLSGCGGGLSEVVAVSLLTNIPALIIGAGPVGVATAFALRARGAQQILVSEPSQARREMLRQTGIVTDIFDPLSTDVSKRCREVLTNGHGVGVVFDCAGTQAGMGAGCASLGFRGVYMNLALPKTPITIPLGPFMRKEITYKSSMAYDQGDFKETVEAFVAGRFKGIEKMITRRITLEDIVEKGFEELVKPNDHIKILGTTRQSGLSF
ncbi:GroES-like protein [Aspergillus cavernicola]|uniref:GroES-like protein n=1 Tax=Aspergillus cavernicola TaxID=176166 RepID=A0ABR4IZT2_9EURO